MALANCSRCKKVFNKMGGNAICEACREREEDDFERCYQFLRQKPNSSVAEVSDATEVDAKQILEWYRTGRLLAGEAGYPCERCGAPTHRGAYCAKCVGNLKTGFTPASAEQAPENEAEGGSAGRREFSHRMRIDQR